MSLPSPRLPRPLSRPGTDEAYINWRDAIHRVVKYFVARGLSGETTARQLFLHARFDAPEHEDEVYTYAASCLFDLLFELQETGYFVPLLADLFEVLTGEATNRQSASSGEKSPWWAPQGVIYTTIKAKAFDPPLPPGYEEARMSLIPVPDPSYVKSDATLVSEFATYGRQHESNLHFWALLRRLAASGVYDPMDLCRGPAAGYLLDVLEMPTLRAVWETDWAAFSLPQPGKEPLASPKDDEVAANRRNLFLRAARKLAADRRVPMEWRGRFALWVADVALTPTRGGSGNTTGSASSANITSTTSSSSSLSAGAVAGIVIGIVFVSVVLLALLAFIIWRRRTRRLEREQYAGAGDPAERRTLDDLAFGPVGKSGHESSSQRMSSALSPISLSSDGSYSQNRQSAFSFAQSAVSDRDTGPSPPSGDRWRYFAHGAPLPQHFAAPGVGQTPPQTQPPFPQTQSPSPPPSSGRAESVISLPNPYSRTSSVAPPARAGRDEFADVAEALGAFMLDPRRATMTSISTATTQAASPGAARSRMENSVATNMSGSPMGERMKQRLAEEREMEELGPSREAHMQAPSDEPPPRYTIGNPPFEMPVREKS
ncbi:hypothetical protein HMN09_00989100 [Mycena chlorophos]|uniref:Uncharacterized protein n=1 Tax=Mycena chlorophos TaxID=658473 RepID=A0A8H6SI67_MYCCL|nr:hypothetical protein HMN09_00989100 [Mycena chlorophos]